MQTIIIMEVHDGSTGKQWLPWKSMMDLQVNN